MTYRAVVLTAIITTCLCLSLSSVLSKVSTSSTCSVVKEINGSVAVSERRPSESPPGGDDTDRTTRRVRLAVETSSNNSSSSVREQWTVHNKLSRGRFAVFTIVKNEPVFLRMWLRHYAREFPREDIYVINNGGNDTIPSEFAGVNMLSRVCEKFFDHQCIIGVVEDTLASLLNDGYKYVVFSEADELLYATYHGGLCKFLSQQTKEHIRARAYEIIHFPDDEPPLDWNEEPVSQRSVLYRHRFYDKAFVNSRPTTFSVGFHLAKDAQSIMNRTFKIHPVVYREPKLTMIHMQKIDYEYFIEKGEWKAKQNHHADISRGVGGHHALTGEKLNKYYWSPIKDRAKEMAAIPLELIREVELQWNQLPAHTHRNCLEVWVSD